jgi:hypothetical protein
VRVGLILVWLAAAVAAGFLGLIIYELKRSPGVRSADATDTGAAKKSMRVEVMSPRQKYNPATRWTVTEHLSAHNVLIAQVETPHLDEAVAIAHQLTEPIKDKYAEVLIYFHRPGRPDTLPPKRVQWTRAAGYVEREYHE